MSRLEADSRHKHNRNNHIDKWVVRKILVNRILKRIYKVQTVLKQNHQTQALSFQPLEGHRSWGSSLLALLDYPAHK